MDHIEEVFNEMLEDIQFIKMATYFRGIKNQKGTPRHSELQHG